MRPETAEWIEMAEADFRTATREVAAEEFPNYDAVCFHAQQSAEKYLKALLVEHGAGSRLCISVCKTLIRSFLFSAMRLIGLRSDIS
jgi:HEPN domain-containing protein